MLPGSTYWTPGPITTMHNNKMWDSLPFRNCSLSIDLTEYQFNTDSNNSDSDNKWTVSKNRGTHFSHLNANSLLPKIKEIRHLVKLTNASVIVIKWNKTWCVCFEQWSCNWGLWSYKNALL